LTTNTSRQNNKKYLANDGVCFETRNFFWEMLMFLNTTQMGPRINHVPIAIGSHGLIIWETPKGLNINRNDNNIGHNPSGVKY